MGQVHTVVDSAGQFFTVGAQLVMVATEVVKTVLVVIWTGLVVDAGVSVKEMDEDVTADTSDEDGDVTADTSEEDDGDVTADTSEEDGVVYTEDDTTAELNTSVTGQTVVETAMVEVTTVVDPAGQFFTVGAQLVMVATEVVKIVDVVMGTPVVTLSDVAGVEELDME